MKGAPEATPPPGLHARRAGPRFSTGMVVLLACLLTLSGCAYFNTFYHAKRYYGQARKAQESAATGKPSGNASDLYKKSIDKCQKVIEKYPGSKWQDDAHLLLAKAYYGRGDYLSAENTLEQFTTKFADSELYPEAMDWKGRTAYAKEDYEDARETWKKLLSRFPKYENREGVEFQMAESLWKDDRDDEAEPALGAYLKAYPGGEHAGQARLALGQLYQDQKRYQEATRAFSEVADRAQSQQDRRQAQLFLGESLESQGRDDDALDLYERLALSLDPDVFTTRMSSEDLALMEENRRLAAEQARQDSLATLTQLGVSSDTTKATTTTEQQQQALANTVNPSQAKKRNPADPRDQQLAQVLLREGRVRARLGQPWDAMEVFKQVLREWPRTPYAAEAQYRIGYTYEVNLEDFDQAQRAYGEVAKEGVSVFRDDAARRAKNLSTVKNLLATASADTAFQARAAAAEARFMRAELYLFQQENPEKATDEYRGIETEFAGSEYAAKAGLALAWVASEQGDSTAAATKYAEVAQDYPRTEYGRRASEVLYGPEPEPEPMDFAGPSLEALRSRENLASIEASLPPKPAAADSAAGPALAATVPPSGTGTGAGPEMIVPKKPVPKVPDSGSLADFVTASRETVSTPPPDGGTPSPGAGSTALSTADGIPTPVAANTTPPGGVAAPFPGEETPATAAGTPAPTAGDAAATPASAGNPTPASATAEGTAPTPSGGAPGGGAPVETPSGPNPGFNPGAETVAGGGEAAAGGKTGEAGLPAAGPDVRARVPVVQPLHPAAETPKAMSEGPAPDVPVSSAAVGLNPLQPVAAATGDSVWTPRRYTPGETVPGHLMGVPRGLYLDPMASPRRGQDAPPPAAGEAGREGKPAAKPDKPAAKEPAKETSKEPPKDPPKDGGAKADSTSGKGDR